MATTKHPRRMGGFMRVSAQPRERARGLNVRTDVGWIEVARVRPCEHDGLHYAKGNAQKLAAGWNLIETIRTEDVAAACRIVAHLEELKANNHFGFDLGPITRIANAVHEALKTQPSDGDSNGYED